MSRGYTSKARLAKGRCDNLFSKIVRYRANGKCQNPACPGGGFRLECSHVYARSYSATRCDFDNAFALCSSCHAFFENRPPDHAEFAKAMLGQERYDALRKRAVGGAKVDWESLADELEAIWKDCQS